MSQEQELDEADVKERNMELWNVLNQTIPPEYLKSFTKNGFSGTEIKPTFRIQRLTETFGPDGTGWGWHILKTWTENWPGVNFSCCYVMASIWYKVGEKEFETSPQIGGTLVDSSPDECWKSAVTDAVGKCASTIGLGADIYLGLVESKYQRPATASQAKSSAATAPVSRPVTAADGKKNEAVVPF